MRTFAQQLDATVKAIYNSGFGVVTFDLITTLAKQLDHKVNVRNVNAHGTIKEWEFSDESISQYSDDDTDDSQRG